MEPITYLHVRGFLQDNMVYLPRFGHESTRPQRAEGSDARYQLVLLDSSSSVLAARTPQVLAPACGHLGDPLLYTVRGALPLHPAAAAYELRCGQICLHRAEIPARAPTVTVHESLKTKDGIKIGWYAPESGRLKYSVVAQLDSGERIPLARDLDDPGFEVDLAHPALAGRGRIFIVATDGVRSSETEGARFSLPERAPIALILSPLADAYLSFGQPLSLIGCYIDPRGTPATPSEVEWRIDAKTVATGTLIAAVEITTHPQTGIAAGPHAVALHCRANGQEAAATVRVTINPPDQRYYDWLAHFGSRDPALPLGRNDDQSSR